MLSNYKYIYILSYNYKLPSEGKCLKYVEIFGMLDMSSSCTHLIFGVFGVRNGTLFLVTHFNSKENLVVQRTLGI